MSYVRIAPLPADFSDAEAISVESLREAWVEQRASLADSGALSGFNAKLVRRWAIETGILEQLYTLDRGTTEILIVRGLDASLVEHSASDIPAAALVEILQDHREAAEYVFDHVTEERDLSLHFVRSLHALLTRHQDTVEVEDREGRRFRTPLVRGKWKSLPNNPRRPDGNVHLYAPPELVEEEMQSLISGYLALRAAKTPAVVAAAWLHHRFTQIHPFQDGNGRVARALTAFALVQADCFPVVVDRDQRAEYIGALETADDGNLRPLVRLFARLEKQELEQALSLSEDALDTAAARPAGGLREKLLAALRDKAREKRSAITVQRKRVMDTGARLMNDVVHPAAEAWGTAVQDVLGDELPESRVSLERSTAGTKHWFKLQVVEIAQRTGYYCDIDTFHQWLRLQVRRPGESDEKASEIVISMHSLGRLFTGVLAVSAYFATRALDEQGRSQSLAPQPLAERVLTFSSFEAEDNVRVRLEEWLGAVLDTGLAELSKAL